MLSDLEADVLLAVEGRPEVESVWRLPPPPKSLRQPWLGESKPPLVRVVLASLQGAVHVLDLPDAERVEWISGMDLPPMAEMLRLDHESRARAVVRRERHRASSRWAPVPELAPAKLLPLPPDIHAYAAAVMRDRNSEVERAAIRIAKANGPPSPASVPREDGSSLDRAMDQVVGVITSDPELVERVRAAVTSNVRVIALESGWELLERTDVAFHRVFWETSPESGTVEARLVRLVARERPDVARVVHFVVDSLRWTRIAFRYENTSHRFLVGIEHEIARVLRDDPAPSKWSRLFP